MSVVVVTDHYRTIRRLIKCLREQTVRDRLEIVIVAPAGVDLDLDPEALDGFAGVRVVEIARINPMSSGRAAGVRAATAPIVFIGETHSFPHPGFAEALIAAHSEPWDAVVPGLSNANPESALSWASFLMDYGQWLDALPAGQIPGGPTWNVAYKKAVLLDLGDRLDGALSHGDELAVELHARGHRAYFEPSAKLDHANISQPFWWLQQRYLCGLLVASSRKARWPRSKRLMYICASPLIPFVVLSRLIRPLKSLARSGTLPLATAPLLVAGAITRTAGEVVGYARGSGAHAQDRMDEYELHKLRFTSLTL
jgi:hypothetical protein